MIKTIITIITTTLLLRRCTYLLLLLLLSAPGEVGEGGVVLLGAVDFKCPLVRIAFLMSDHSLCMLSATRCLASDSV